MEEDCCIAAFLRGAFLMAGTVAGPDKKSHLELKSTHQSLVGEETSLMLDLGLSPKQAKRANALLLYFKDGASVEDFLTRIGAPHAAMELMQAKVEKNLRNTINRQVNCETANLVKAADASARQIAAIQSVRKACAKPCGCGSGIRPTASPSLRGALTRPSPSRDSATG